MATISLPSSERGTDAWYRELEETLRLLRDGVEASGSR